MEKRASLIRNPYGLHLSDESALHKYSLCPYMESLFLHIPVSDHAEALLQ